MITLGFDTSGPYCAAALLRDGEVLEAVAEPMQRGQAERLMPMLEGVLHEHGLTWQDVDRIGVGIGPGNFTGIRIAVAAARGLALGRGVPAVGISSFDAVRFGTSCSVVAVPAPREMAYFQDGDDPAMLIPKAEVAKDALWPADSATLAANIARCAETRTPEGRPAPLYLRPADAAPPRDAPPVILDAR